MWTQPRRTIGAGWRGTRLRRTACATLRLPRCARPACSRRARRERFPLANDLLSKSSADILTFRRVTVCRAKPLLSKLAHLCYNRLDNGVSSQKTGMIREQELKHEVDQTLLAAFAATFIPRWDTYSVQVE